MSSKTKPTGLKRAFLRECFDVLSAEPPVARWRMRPRSHFPAGKGGDQAFEVWGRSFAGQTIRMQTDGRMRITLT